MRKLEEFKMADFLSENEMSNISGGKSALASDVSRTLCTTETCNSGCSDIQSTRTRDENGVTTVTVETYDLNEDCPK